jgi:hypothetical protein
MSDRFEFFDRGSLLHFTLRSSRGPNAMMALVNPCAPKTKRSEQSCGHYSPDHRWYGRRSSRYCGEPPEALPPAHQKPIQPWAISLAHWAEE